MSRLDPLPCPAECINLSISHELLSGEFADASGRNLRTAIRDYRHNVRCKMFAQPTGAITPWGVWEAAPEGRAGLYRLNSSLNNRFLDTELAAPFIPGDKYREIYDRMNDDGGIRVEESLPARTLVRDTGRKHLMRTLHLPEKVSHPAEPMIRVRAVSPTRFDLLDYTNGRADRELAYGVNEVSLLSNRLLLQHASRKVLDAKKLAITSKHADPNNFDFWIELCCDDIMPLDLTFHAPCEQWFFIDLPTLATMSCNFAIKDPLMERVWLYWSTMAGLAGLPAAVLTQHGKMEPKHPLSPCNMRLDPIFTVLYGMWALGAADEFNIHLSLNHPVRGLRGAYIDFSLGGGGNRLLYDVVNESSLSEQLRHPVFGDADPPGTKSILNYFEEGKEAKA